MHIGNIAKACMMLMAITLNRRTTVVRNKKYEDYNKT